VLEHGSGILELTDEELLSLGDKYAMLSDKSGSYTDAARQSVNTTADLTGQNSTFANSQDQVNQSLDDGSVAFDSVGASAEEFGDTIEEVQNQGGFFEGIKQGFIDFVENVQSNSELMADFFADTLSQMSQSFSDLFFNVITGKFDDLKDLAKQAFEAILRAFLDLVSAIATRQIVISIGGLFGIGKGAQAAGGSGSPTDIAQQGAGVVGSGLGLFGAGGAFETVGVEEAEYRLAA
jgi:lambda family phage tail tape measure protein